MKRISIIFIVVLFVACIGLIYGGIFWNRQNTLSYVEEVSNMSFPTGISQIDVYDNGEFFLVTHIKLPNEEISSFKSMYELDIVTTQNTIRTSPTQNIFVWAEYLKPENQLLPTDAVFLFVEGCSENNSWIHVLDEGSGRLWSVVFYPDWSGDAFECRK